MEPGAGFKAVAYYANCDSWNDTGNNVYGCMKQLFLLKKRHRHLKVLLSIGGWTYSSNFAQPASTPAGRETFAKSAVQLVKNLGLDGLDIDWEYPKDDAEAQNYVHLLKETHANYQKLHLRAMDPYLDFWNLMAYDYAGSWDTHAGHQANIYPSSTNPCSTPYSTHAAVEAYVGAGIPRSKLVIGMPLYGRAFTNTSGPGKPFYGAGEGSWEQGVWDAKVLPKEGAREEWDDEVKASFSYDPVKNIMVSYDSKRAMEWKGDWIRREGFGGAMWWETSGDSKGPECLISAVVDKLCNLDRSNNTLEYPESKYDNLRMGFPNE
ncbi:MAG: hypothetical protein Q9163_003044 [Psora crenata]